MKNLLFIFAAFALTFASCGKAETGETLSGELNAVADIELPAPTELTINVESRKLSQNYEAVTKSVISHMVDYRYPREIAFPYDLKLEFVWEIWDDMRPSDWGKTYERIETMNVKAGTYAPSFDYFHKLYFGAQSVLYSTSTLKEVRVTRQNSSDRIRYSVTILPVTF